MWDPIGQDQSKQTKHDCLSSRILSTVLFVIEKMTAGPRRATFLGPTAR